MEKKNRENDRLVIYSHARTARTHARSEMKQKHARAHAACVLGACIFNVRTPTAIKTVRACTPVCVRADSWNGGGRWCVRACE